MGSWPTKKNAEMKVTDTIVVNRVPSDEAPESRLSTEKETKEVENTGSNEVLPDYPTGLRLGLVFSGLCAAIFLVVLDQTIISTAIPTITDHFKSLGDIGWYGSAYMLTLSVFQLLFGQFYTLFSPKWVFVVSIGIFEAGSILCGASPTSKAFIVGRAITGVGCSGLLLGSWVILAYVLPLQKRAVYGGFMGAFAGVGTVVGPLLSGAFTDSRLTWRWCFYINAPLGAIVLALVMFSLTDPEADENRRLYLGEKIRRFDIVGILLFLPTIICLLLALQFGGSTYSWSDGRVIALLVIFGVFLVAFGVVQFLKKDKAALPPRILRQRNVLYGALYAFCIDGCYYTADFYLPIWYQVIQGQSAQGSSYRTLSLVVSQVFAAALAGWLITRYGWFNPFMVAGSVLAAVGSGILTTFTVRSGAGAWITYPLLIGIGVGLGTQQPLVGVQAAMSLEDVPTGTAAVTLFQNLGPAIAIPIAQNIFTDRLAKVLDEAHIPGLGTATILKTGATELRSYLGSNHLDVVLFAYNDAITRTFYVLVGLTCLSVVGALGMKWKKLVE